jgi:hypothetical protein
MALQFPSDPASVGNVYEAPNGVIYYYDGIKWSGHGVPANVSIAESTQDATAAMLAAGTQSGISVTYNDAANSMDLTVQIPTASATVLGGIKIGNNLTITDGVLSASAGTPTLSTPAGDAIPPTVLDQTKQIFVLGSGTYKLENGSDGQICYFLTQAGGTRADTLVAVDNIRIISNNTSTIVALASWYPFDNTAGSEADAAATATAIFTEGAWNVSQGLVNPTP